MPTKQTNFFFPQDAQDLSDVGYLMKGNESYYPNPATLAVQLGVRGIAKDYVDAINDVHTGKTTEADRDERINQSSADARQFWGNVSDNVNTAQGRLSWAVFPEAVSAIGAPGTPLASSDAVRPPAFQNPAGTAFVPPPGDTIMSAEQPYKVDWNNFPQAQPVKLNAPEMPDPQANGIDWHNFPVAKVQETGET